ncbi:glycosyltransferase [Thauera aminoaromatica]|uniref:glycosyltransferase n=1 Tax=Thauera aminoaromatica TaxID=164330 RepID=UPI00235719DD|nr:nucleotide disphospho-sugar-binding domain-containing protein [Thauera aminoaromatica]MCK6398996.1 glycosyl transferase UDP-glucuronosyltransferase [Thauera aminoaromatica]
MPASPLKILFFAEGATLAHVARPYVVAQSLSPEAFEVVFARPSSFAWLTAGSGFRTIDLPCQDGKVFARRLEHGRPLYDYATLAAYVEQDLALIDAERPDVVVGDFRLSLSVSARLRNVPYVTICDAYWSPEYPSQPPLPVLSFTRFTPIPLASLLFRYVAPLAMRLHTLPLERLRAHHGLPSLGHDLRRCYTDADLRLFANFPELFPELMESRHASFIGPISWSPPADAPLEFARSGRPLVYVTMGSSGDVGVLGGVIEALGAFDCEIVVTTAGRKIPAELRSSSTRIFDYLPGDQVCRLASLVVCNGGSPTTNQALAHGVPVLGIASNMDQFLNMRAVEEFGAGILVRGDRARPARLRAAARALLTHAPYGARARDLATAAAKRTASATFAHSIQGLLQGSAPRN